VFRPNKEKELTLVDFTRAVDNVYRELKTLSAAVRNASASKSVLHVKILTCTPFSHPTFEFFFPVDRVFESILNFLFYIFLYWIVFIFLDSLDAINFSLALASIIFSCSFVIGSACSSVFEGILMILIRRPYDIGDRIHIMEVDQDTNPSGSSGWLVEGKLRDSGNVSRHISRRALCSSPFFGFDIICRYITLPHKVTIQLDSGSRDCFEWQYCTQPYHQCE